MGLRDLQEGIIKTPLDPLNTFLDDPLSLNYNSGLGFTLGGNNPLKQIK